MPPSKTWSLNRPSRVGIACVALAYLLFAAPWRQPHPNGSAAAYACAAAMATLALLPARTRVWVAILVALGVACGVDVFAGL